MIRVSHMCRQSNVYLLLIVVITIMNMGLFDCMLIVIYSKKSVEVGNGSLIELDYMHSSVTDRDKQIWKNNQRRLTVKYTKTHSYTIQIGAIQ